MPLSMPLSLLPNNMCDGLTVMLQVLIGLERLGYRVVTCSSILTGITKFDTKDVIWTLHKAREDWETGSSK